MKSGFLDKLVARLDRVDQGEVQQIVARLIQEKGFLENVFEALQEGLIILDTGGKILFLNRAASQFFGLDPAESLGEPIRSKIDGLGAFPRHEGKQSVSRDIEVFYPEPRRLNFYLAPIDDPKNYELPLGHVMFIRDTTHTHEENLENLESERLNALTLLAAGVAHEIGNPLNSLDIHLQLMERKLKKLPQSSRDSLSEHMRITRQEIQRLDGILKQFLGAVRPTTPRREQTDLNQLLRNTLDTLEPELESRGIQIELDLSETMPTALIDPDQFQQVFYNILRNSYQAISGEGGIIQIRGRSTETDFLINISDNGTGISPESMGSLFEPYYTTKASGTGLGLLIVRRIIREHGGEIEIKSEPDNGTSLSIQLPHTIPGPRLLPSPTINL